jgi:hypothetical protein
MGFLLLLVGLAAAAAVFAQNSNLTARAQLLDKQAFYIAEAGVERGRQTLSDGTWALGSTTVESFGAGQYSVAISDNGDCGIDDNDCEITIASSAYIPDSTSYVARRQLVEEDIPALVSNTNLSLTATASASSSSGSHPAGDANDDDTGSYWESNVNGNGSWLQMDHGSAVTVNQIVIEEQNRIDGISALEYSDDGSSWTAVSGLSVVESPSKTWTCDFTSTSRRYFRATFTASASNRKVSVEEMRNFDTTAQTVAFSDVGDFETSW